MINKNWKIIISLLLILSIFSKISAQNTNPEPYGKYEFPSWAKDLRRTEIITFGSLPFATLGVTLGYGIIKYANGSSTSIANPFNKSSSQYSLDEQKKILGISCAVSLALGLTDLGVNHITRFIKRKKMQKVNRLKEIEKIINEPTSLTEFNREIFDTIVYKIVVGEVSETGEIKPNVIRFILRTGAEYKTITNNNRNKNVSLCTKARRNANT